MAYTDTIELATLAASDAVLSRLLERSRGHSAEFGHLLANHLPMMLVALRRMGASNRRLEEWFETYRVANALAPPPASEGRIDRRNWLDHRGDRSFEGDYRAFFAAETERLGIGAVQATYLPDLVPGIAASALHAMMRLAYANDRDDPAEISVGLGYWAATWLPLRSIDEATPQTDDPAALLSVLRERMAATPIEPPTDLLWHWMREVAGRPEFPPVAALLEAGPELRTSIASASLALMAGKMTFEALHAVTGTHWIRMMKGRWPDEGLTLRYFWQAIASVYPKIGLPSLPDEAEMAAMRALPCPDWREIHAMAVDSDDEHDVSFAFSAGEEERFSGDRLYRVLAARRVGLLMSGDLFLTDGLLADGSVVDILIESGRIASVTPNGSSTREGIAIEELAGALVLPGLIEGHIHLDKTLLGIPWVPHLPGESVAERIAAEKRLRRELDAPIEARARALLERCVAYGTTAMRCHVDIDAEIGLRGLEALLALRDACADLVDIQFVAFPQSGLVTHPGARELMDEALGNGATVVGGLDPAGIDNDVEGQLDAIFALARRHAAMIDIHLHDPGELGAFELRQIAARARSEGLEGRVAVSHAFALGEISEATFGATAEALARGGVAIMTNGPGPVPMPPVKRLRDHGVTVFTGSDNIRDAWSPLGNGDLLEGAARIAWRQGFASDEDLRLALALVTDHAASVLGHDAPAIAAGAVADLIVVRATNASEAVAAHPPRALVAKRGRIVARDGKLVL